MPELATEMIVDQHARTALARLRARVARRPGRWRQRMSGWATGRSPRAEQAERRGLAIAA